MFYVWLVLGACSVYLFTLGVLWIWIARLHAPFDIVQRAIKIPSQVGIVAFDLNMVFRFAVASAKNADLEASVKRAADSAWGAMESMDYSALNALSAFGVHGVRRVLACLAANEFESSGLNQNAFVDFPHVLKHDKFDLSEPVLNALRGCVEEIRKEAFADDPGFADPKHPVNAVCGSSVLVIMIRKHLEKMISETV